MSAPVAGTPAAGPVLGEKTVRRNAIILAAAQALCGASGPVAISIGGLAGSWLLLADKSLATLPVTGYNLGVALGALPAAALMRAVGRRYGFISGALITSAGGLVAATALFQENFWLFAFALMLIGVGGSFVQQYRFAATDGARRSFQSRAISIVLAGGIFAAVIGPQTVRYTADLFLPVEFAGAFIGLVFLGLAGAAILSFLRIPDSPDEGHPADLLPARPLATVVAQPRFLAGLCCGVGSFAMMSFVMTGAPLAMVGCGLSKDISTLGIQWHVLAMFGPSFFTGRLIQRFGKERIVATGLLLLAASAAVSLSGLAVWQFWTGLILLGLGWNFGFIGSTAIVAETYRPSEKNKTQGLHDFVLFSSVSLASFLSGRTFVAAGWETMNMVVFPVVLVCLVVLVLQARFAPLQPAAD
ncbi:MULTISPECIES: MFS transporter [Aurantimonas]|uniref:MFS transporter n=1 Tax=Aurantimonas TaxID=182269 RepID=UPI0035126EB2